MRRRSELQVVPQLLVDVLEAARQGAHVLLDGEREADRMPGRRVRVLADDEHAHVVEGRLECAEHVAAGREVLAPGGDFAAQERPHVGDPVGDRLERGGPAGIHRSFGGQLDEGLHSPAVTGGSADQGKVIQRSVRRQTKSGSSTVRGLL